jgi:2'-5' RNA ligase
MTVARIFRVPDGRYRRLWLELPLEDDHGVRLLQEQLASIQGDFQPQPTEKLHVTILHLGPPADLLSEVRRSPYGNERLELSPFLRGLEEFMACVMARPLRWSGAMRVRGLELFGSPEHPAVAIRLRRHPALSAWQAHAWAELMALLKRLGAAEPERFAAASTQLGFSRPRVYRPHLTLGAWAADQPLPAVSLELTRLRLTGPRLRGAALLSGSR